MITGKQCEELIKKYQNDIPIIFAVVSQKVDCCGYPEREANDWFVLGYGRLEYPYVYTTFGKIPLCRCYEDRAEAQEEADMRNGIANTYIKEKKHKGVPNGVKVWVCARDYGNHTARVLEMTFGDAVDYEYDLGDIYFDKRAAEEQLKKFEEAK